MALAETAELAVKLSLVDKLSPGINKVQHRLSGLGGTAKTVGKGIAVGLGTVATGGIVLLGKALKDGLDALKADKVVAAQTAAVLKSTGGAAGVTAQQVSDLADKYSLLDGVQDDVVQSAENVLLTFTNIGKDAFEPATAAALDFAAATGTNATSAAKLLGRALNDPIRGMSFLRRAGISLDAETEKQIKGLVKQGHLYEAQKILLAEVAKRYGGVAKAQADADPSRRLNVAVEKLQKALAKGLLPVIEKVSVRLTEFLSKPETIAAVERLGNAIAALFTDDNLSAVAGGLETAAKAVSVAISAFNSLPPEIKALAIGAFTINKVTGGAVGGAASAFGKILGAGLQKIFAANVTVIGATVTGPGGPSVPGAPTGPGGGPLDTVKNLLAGLLGGGATVALDSESRAKLDQNAQKFAQAVQQQGQDNRSFIERLITPFDPRATVAAINHAATLEDQNIRGEGAKHRAAIGRVEAKQRESLIAFRAGERATQTGNSLSRTANARLDAIRRKRTSFRINNNIGISTFVRVADIDRSSGYRTRVARSTSLSAQ